MTVQQAEKMDERIAALTEEALTANQATGFYLFCTLFFFSILTTFDFIWTKLGID